MLHAALADVIPENLLCRRTKSGYNADIHHGWSVHRDQLTELVAQPPVGRVRARRLERMRRALAAFGPSGLPPAWVTDLIAVETWLRDLDRDLAPPPARSRRLSVNALRAAYSATSSPVRLAGTVHTTTAEDGVTLLDVHRGTLYHVNQAGADRDRREIGVGLQVQPGLST